MQVIQQVIHVYKVITKCN